MRKEMWLYSLHDFSYNFFLQFLIVSKLLLFLYSEATGWSGNGNNIFSVMEKGTLVMVEKITIIMIWKSTYRETIGMGETREGEEGWEPIIELQ